MPCVNIHPYVPPYNNQLANKERRINVNSPALGPGIGEEELETTAAAKL